MIVLFPKFVVIALIFAALGLTAVGVLTLLWMVVKDIISKDLW